MGNVVINASTNIGDQCIINTLASVGHDITIKTLFTSHPILHLLEGYL